ncbi:MAG: uroporphyrinogen-III C-methyltransferase [Deltaproteobacteria bacterium]|nr:uroporphyrinogen-III C-methyltransferase [Deltaproteobacteria bacterium]
MAGVKVYLVGAGPGDAELITLKGVRALKRADCVIYDFLSNESLLSHVKAKAETIYVGKKGAFRHVTQGEINELILKKAKAGKVVVRLKGGDPFIYGRGGEEALALVNAGLSFEIIPGVSSAVAAPAFAGIPLTHRGVASTVTFLTGHESQFKKSSKVEWEKLATSGGTLVILMGWKKLALTVKRLSDGGMNQKTPVAIIRWGSTSKQKTITGTLKTIVALVKEHAMKPPIITVIGNVVTLREKLKWFDSRPLFGKKILVTRTAKQAGTFSSKLTEMGAEVVSLPVIKTINPPSFAKLDKGIKNLETYDWAIFTSVNGVEYFFSRLYKLGLDIRALKGVKICVVGSATEQAIKNRGIQVDLVPKKFVAEGILKALGKNGIKGNRFLLPRALKAREILPDEIRRLGGMIDVAPAYKTIRVAKTGSEILSLLKKGKLDVITFTSASTVKNFLSFFKKNEVSKLTSNVIIACIGPVTKQMAIDNGLKVDIMPSRYTIPAFAEAMENFFSADKNS